MPRYINVNKPVVEMYNKGLGVCEIAKRLNVNRSKVLSTLKENNIITQRITRPYKNFFNIDFFKDFNEKSCYWAGFIMADGNIHTKRRSLSIALSSVDKDHLIKFKNDIEFTGPVSDYKGFDKKYNTDINYSKINVNGKWFADDLEKNFNIIPNKTHNTIFPKIPEEFIPEFIRGYFDGDGCLTKSGAYGTIDEVSLLGTSDFLKKIQEYFYEKGLRVKNNNKNGYGKLTLSRNIYKMSYSGKNAHKFLNIIYGSSNTNTHLDRKYNKYLLTL